MSEISTCIQVGIKIGQTTMATRKTTLRGTGTKLTTSMADLGSVVRFNPIRSNSLSFSFVRNETLQLIEAPVAQHSVESFAFSLFPDAFQVFHHNLVSFEPGNNVFAYTVVYMLHPTSFSSREILQKPLSGTSAFRLKLGTQILELPFNLLDFSRIIKPAVATDGEVVYSEVNAQNNVLRSVVLLSGSNLFREREQEETSTFFVHSQQTFRHFPIKVISVTSRNVEFELLSTLKQTQNKSVPFEVCTSWKVVSDTCSFDDGFAFSLFDHATSLSHTSNSYLSREFKTLSDSIIDSIMEFEILSDFMFPSIIDTELHRFCVSLDSRDYFKGWIDTYFSSNYASHKNYNINDIFKCYVGLSSEM